MFAIYGCVLVKVLAPNISIKQLYVKTAVVLHEIFGTKKAHSYLRALLNDFLVNFLVNT